MARLQQISDPNLNPLHLLCLRGGDDFGRRRQSHFVGLHTVGDLCGNPGERRLSLADKTAGGKQECLPRRGLREGITVD
jgi:hypothetical protein